MVLARIVAALLMAFVVGGVMQLVFRGAARSVPVALSTAGPSGTTRMLEPGGLGLLLLLLLALLLPNYLVQSGPYALKVVVWAALSAACALYAWRRLAAEKLRDWLRESWWFVRTIFPLLLLGVFLVGVIGHLLPEAWIRTWLGGNGLGANLLATLIGAFSYFATMTEAPFVDTLMNLGMGKGPALALLLTGPGLSLPNWLAIARVFGPRQALVYVPTLMVLGTLVGWVYGNLFT
jgi:uncharacterized membrane protein YraQ (UPF0718 family)